MFSNGSIKKEIAPYILDRLLSFISLLNLIVISYTLIAKSTLYMEISLKLKLLLISMVVLSYIVYEDKLRILYGVTAFPIITLLYYLLLTSGDFSLNVMISFTIFLLTCEIYYNSRRPMFLLGYRFPIFLPQFVFQYTLLTLLLLTVDLSIIERVFVVIGVALLLYKLSSYLRGPIFNLWSLCLQNLMREISVIRELLSKLNYHLTRKRIEQYLNKREIVFIHKTPLKTFYKAVCRKMIVYKYYQSRAFSLLLDVLNELANINLETYISAISKIAKNFVKQIIHVERKTLNTFKIISKYLEHVQESVEHSLTLSSFLIGLIVLIIVLIYLVLMYLT